MSPPGFRRDLGRWESYSTLIGILVGAGIFRVTSDAYQLTGSSVILGYLVLAPMVLATSIPYAMYLSTPLGKTPGGEYTHISRAFGNDHLAFIGVWLKMIAYIGALAFLGNAFADYGLDLLGKQANETSRLWVAGGVLMVFYVVHVSGVRWFGKLQVAMFAVLMVSIVALVIPGLFHLTRANYQPIFSHGATGFTNALPPLFFAYAGFESLAQTAGEVRDSTNRLPRVFLRGVLWTSLIFFLMSCVMFGVLPGSQIAGTTTPMLEVAAVYLPFGASWIVGVGALMAITTSMNATMMVPSRLAWMLSQDNLVPKRLGQLNSRTATPILGLTLTFGLAFMLLLTKQLSLALNIAVLALIVLYALHSLSFLLLPKLNPQLNASVRSSLPSWLRQTATVVSLGAMMGLIVVMVAGDLRTIQQQGLLQGDRLTSLELLLIWALIGWIIRLIVHRRA